MAKVSQIDKAIAALKAERDILDLAIAKLEAQQSAKAAKPNGKTKTRKRQARVETTVLGQIDYPQA